MTNERIRVIGYARPPSPRAVDRSGEHTRFVGCFDEAGRFRSIYNLLPPEWVVIVGVVAHGRQPS